MKKKLPAPRTPALFDTRFQQEAARAAIERSREAREAKAMKRRGGRKPMGLVNRP
jgi:hypothetical protein